ncbi:TPA: hypothetical protein HA361_03430 [Candidatus Woesearchaeota archaeon]|nr:hypothetical protein [Candidatus Woesearchaeota archaeon]
MNPAIKSILLILCLFLSAAPALAVTETSHMKLLAVKENGDEQLGGIADLTLELRDGSGKVFLETIPVLRQDTQISARLAKDIACDYVRLDCDTYDFFYAIKAESSLLGGPSAGAAIAALTVAALEELPINEKVAVTGTINSGGTVGPVGGVKAKIDAAARDGIATVLIPRGELIVDDKSDNETNQTLNLSARAKGLGIIVKEVDNLEQVLEEFTGISQPKPPALAIDESYTKTMKELAAELCNRSDKLKEKVNGLNDRTNSTRRGIENAQNLTASAQQAMERDDYYSAASFCYGANVRYSELILNLEGNQARGLRLKRNAIIKSLGDLDDAITKKEKMTITDLEAYMIVKDRLVEAATILRDINESNINGSLGSLAYAGERVYSGYAWSKYLDGRGAKMAFNHDLLKSACQKKFSEAQEHIQYAHITTVLPLSGAEEELELARGFMDEGNYELCIFKAGKAKAEANLILTAVTAGMDDLPGLVTRKLAIASSVIAKQAAKGSFPVLGYSYYEYSDSLRESDPASALLYAEYALELSNLDIYLHEKAQQKKPLLDERAIPLIIATIAAFLAGFAIGWVGRAKMAGKPKSRGKKQEKSHS